MTHRIDEDRKDFHDIYSGRRRKGMKKYINNGSIFRKRGKNGKISITVPGIDIPHLVHGDSDQGVGRGAVKPGDVIGKDDEEGQGNQAGREAGEGVEITVDLEEILQFLQKDLELPDLLPKPNETYEQEEIKYNSISLTGPASLLHKSKTIRQALKRQLADGSYFKKHQIPGFKDPVNLITPINHDKRFRQWNIIKKPASNAVVFFARDGSASMDQYKCDIVSDMAWWIDQWIRRFYKRVERCYIWHDTRAQEVDEQKFYKYRYGGGTECSSALELISKQFDNRFPPSKWNIYIIYFSDGENWGEDNAKFCEIIKEKFNPNVVNLFGLAQIMAYSPQGSLKEYVDTHLAGLPNLRTTAVGQEGRTGYNMELAEADRDAQVRQAIIDILGKSGKKGSPKTTTGF